MEFERAFPNAKPRFFAFSAVAAATLLGCNGHEQVAGSPGALVAVCSETAATVPAGAWICPNSLTVECNGGNGKADVDAIYYVTDGESCTGLGVVVNDPGPFTVGTHTIDVTLGGADGGLDGGSALCSAQLVVVDTLPPVATPHQVVLWPPNHTMHAITPDDCVTVQDSCDGTIHAQFTSGTSDEPENDLGDGNTTPDLVVAHDGVQARAEREGGGDGRVYRLGFVATDAAGHSVEGTCTVVVPHDQSGRPAVEGAPVYTKTP